MNALADDVELKSYKTETIVTGTGYQRRSDELVFILLLYFFVHLILLHINRFKFLWIIS